MNVSQPQQLDGGDTCVTRLRLSLLETSLHSDRSGQCFWDVELWEFTAQWDRLVLRLVGGPGQMWVVGTELTSTSVLQAVVSPFAVTEQLKPSCSVKKTP